MKRLFAGTAVVISVLLLNGCSNNLLTAQNSESQNETDGFLNDNSYYSSVNDLTEYHPEDTSSLESDSSSNNEPASNKGFNDYKIPKENMRKIVYTLSLPDSKKTSEYDCEDDYVNAMFFYYDSGDVKNTSCYINFKSDVSMTQSIKYILGFRSRNSDTIFNLIENEGYSDIVLVFCDINGNAYAVWLCGISESGERINDFISLDEDFFDEYYNIYSDDSLLKQAKTEFGESSIKVIGEQSVDVPTIESASESQVTTPISSQTDEIQEPAVTLETNSETSLRYTGSTLKVGIDIPEGEYVIFTNSNSSYGYMAVCNDANGDDIYFNENFSYNTIVTIKNGQYLKLNRCYAVPFSEATVDTSGSGMFKVGTHIAEGEYKISLNNSESHGYYAIYPDSTQQDIISNENFDSDTYVNVKNGEYLLLNRCHLVK